MLTQINSGGGITGLTFANLLLGHLDKVEFTIYESHKKFKEIGAGIGVWARAMEVLKQAGVDDACSKVAVRPDPNDPGELDILIYSAQRGRH